MRSSTNQGHVTVTTADRRLDALLPFTTLGGFSAFEGALSAYGELPEEYVTEYVANRDKIVYTVLSYQTPIAWVIKNGDGHTTVIPKVRYSNTTNKHQAQCRRHMPFQN